MCLAIPGQIDKVLPESDLATAHVSGVKRNANIGLVRPEGIEVGDWVLIHVGFADRGGERRRHRSHFRSAIDRSCSTRRRADRDLHQRPIAQRHRGG